MGEAVGTLTGLAALRALLRHPAALLAWAVVAMNLALWAAFFSAWLARDLAPVPGAIPQDGAYWLVVRLIQMVALLAAAGIGALVVARQPGNPVGWIICAASTFAAFEFAALEYGVLGTYTRRLEGPPPGVVAVAWTAAWLNAANAVLDVPMLLLFPDGRLPSARWRPLLWLAAALGLALGLSLALRPGPLPYAPGFANPLGLPTYPESVAALQRPLVLWALPLVNMLAAVSLGFRLRSATGERRLQLKWIAYAAILYWLIVVSSALTPVAWRPLVDVVYVLSHGAFVLALGLAVLRFRLYEIDLVINRTLVYGALAACITVAYLGVVVLAGSLVGAAGQPSLLLSLLVTAVVALAFEPLRERFQLLANRLVYGQRESPYEVLAGFSRRIAEVLSVDDVLPRMAEAAARGVGATSSRVSVFLQDGSDRSVAWTDGGKRQGQVGGRSQTFEHSIPVMHQGELVGEIGIDLPSGQQLRLSEARLLADLAAEAGIALSNVRLALELEARLDQLSRQAEELRASRQRLVAAQDAERRRLERDLHDGAQQRLVGLAVQLRLLGSALGRDPARAAGLVDELAANLDEALAELRDLARGIYPAVLADRGLVAALRTHVAKSSPSAKLAIEGELADQPLPPDVAMAAYFCVREALQNAAKHAPGAVVTVRLAREEGRLRFSVADDGPGFDASRRWEGTGLQGMADRVAAVGGVLEVTTSPGRGAVVEGRIPLETSTPGGVVARAA